jgi:uncharacterized membrane protein
MSEMPHTFAFTVLRAVGIALCIAGLNVGAALMLARIAARQVAMNTFFRIVVGSLVTRSVLTLAAFGLTFAQMQSQTERFAFALAFILSYACLLAAEVVVIHRSQTAHKLRHARHSGDDGEAAENTKANADGEFTLTRRG